MAFIRNGYVVRASQCTKGRHGKRPYRDWWLLKSKQPSGGAQIRILAIHFPEEYVGKRIKIKIEVIK